MVRNLRLTDRKPKGDIITYQNDIQEKLKQGKDGDYTRWAKNFNLKEISKTLMYLDSCGVR